MRNQEFHTTVCLSVSRINMDGQGNDCDLDLLVRGVVEHNPNFQLRKVSIRQVLHDDGTNDSFEDELSEEEEAGAEGEILKAWSSHVDGIVEEATCRREDEWKDLRREP